MDTYCQGNISLHLKDCFKGIIECEPNSVDVVVTSPPYNIGVKYSAYDDTMSRPDYLAWLDQWASLVKESMTQEGSLFLNIGSKPTDPWVPFEVIDVMRKHFQLQNVIHWIKSIYVENDSYGEKTALSVGHYKPISSKRFVNDTHEYVFHLTKTGKVELDRLAIGVPYKDKSNIARWKASGGDDKPDVRCRGNTWYIPYKTIQRRSNDRPHPASFPPELAEMCIKLHGVDKTKMVLDPFMGIGSTALASVKLGIPCTGFEIDEEYFKQACNRLQEQENLFSGIE